MFRAILEYVRGGYEKNVLLFINVINFYILVYILCCGQLIQTLDPIVGFF
jgi:hypothetical protein